MKILNQAQIKEADAYTIEHEPIKSIDLMERAATKCVDWIIENIDKEKTFHIVCGLGNNGGDGLAIARLLIKKDYKVSCYVIVYSDKYSDDFSENQNRLIENKMEIIALNEENFGNLLKEISIEDIVVDAIFGSGLNKPINGWLGKLIRTLNGLGSSIISIDMPSGLFGENNSLNQLNNIVKATYTLTFQVPKLSFLFPKTRVFTGEFVVLDIGLDQDFIANLKSCNYFITQSELRTLLKKKQKSPQKDSYGHALLFAGSYREMGAVIISANSCLITGVGLLTIHVAQSGYKIKQIEVPESMTYIEATEHFITENIALKKYDAVGVGSGIGIAKQTQDFLKLLLQNATKPVVVGGDALIIIAENKSWLSLLPENSILVANPEEFEKFTKITVDDEECYQFQKDFAVKHKVYVVLQEAHTRVSCPNGDVYFTGTVNHGIVKEDNEHILTGMLTGLLAQGYTPIDACLIGVYLHGLGGVLAAKNIKETAIVAPDMIDCLGEAFSYFDREN